MFSPFFEKRFQNIKFAQLVVKALSRVHLQLKLKNIAFVRFLRKFQVKMLLSMLKQHQEQIKGRNETQEKLKRETVEAANELTVNLVRFCFDVCIVVF